MANVQSIDPYKVCEIQSLGKQDDKTAKELLGRVALQVQPILRRRKFRVPLLKEFFPANPCLLGMNYGGGGGDCQEIMLRLRPAASGGFLPYESVLSTMLHEITHNVRGPHDAQFYKLLDELKAECEDLMARGISGTGAGFDAKAAGKVGGRFVGRELPQHERREVALKAAEQRARRAAVMPAGPRQLGGDLTLRQTCDPREAAATAAERRMRDNVWCPAERLREEEEAGHDMHDALKAILDNANRAGGGLPTAAGGSKAGSAAGSGQVDEPRSESKRHRKLDEAAVAAAAPAGRATATAGSALPRASAPGATAVAMAMGTIDSTNEGTADIVDLTADEDPPLLLPVATAKRQHMAAGRVGAVARSAVSEEGWACPRCTLLNRPLALQCDACQTVQPARLVAHTATRKA